MKTLSICIPTFNRKEYLKQLLESIFSQNFSDIEICVSDNHSLDGTFEYLHQLKLEHFPLILHRFETQVSCGENLMHAAKMGEGEFIWLMSDDDKIEKNGLERVLSFLAHNRKLSGLSLNVEGYEKNLEKKKKIKYSHHLKRDEIFECPDRAYSFLGAWWGFWSAQIIRRELWMSAMKDSLYLQFLGYHHLYLISKIVKERPYWGFLFEKCVGYRADNESFTKEYGAYTRFSIDANGYALIGASFFSGDSCAKVNKNVLKKLLFWQIVRAKYRGLSCKTLKEIFFLSLKIYYPFAFFWCCFLPLLVTPKSVLTFVRAIYKLKIWKK